ncbi:F-box protein At2g26160-like [Pistacia vera]|uniref:F-box protein At2g26160-like n=1 Tax=Pistacia vera TaxID=55513 RepID=UPI0012634F40|nr:F-box protein At2g26160-like [Pistacia vera]XP_031287353.1 F-box protein At2g26160-like [Pistacia vera]
MSNSDCSSSPSSQRSRRVRVSAFPSDTPNWLSLPDDLFPCVTIRLNSKVDTQSFRAVCRKLHSVISPPRALHSPLSKLIRINFPDCKKRHPGGHLLLSQSTIYAIEPLGEILNAHDTKTWWVRVKESYNGKVQLEDPFSGRRVKNFTGIIPKHLSSLNYRVKEITKVYRLEFVGRSTTTSGKFNSWEPNFFQKVVASPCLEENGADFSMMVMYSPDEILAAWRYGEAKWRDIEFFKDDMLADIVYHDGKFYALGYLGSLLCFDIKTGVDTKLMPPGQHDRCFGCGSRYLVDSLKDLFLVVKRCRDTIMVLKLNKKRLKWEPVRDYLGDRVLFVSKNCTYSVSAKEFWGCKPNCIYYTDEFPFCYEDGVPTRPGKNARIYDLKKHVAGRPSTFPGYGKLFWPPPPWLTDLPEYLYHDSDCKCFSFFF